MFNSVKYSDSQALRRLRVAAVALFAAACCLAFAAQQADAAATLNVSTDANTVGSNTSLTVNTALSGYGNAKKQYGASVTLPAALRVGYPSYGSPAQQCPASAYSALNTGITPPATAFSNAGCPAEARIGTATLGSASGGIYWVGVSPLPQLGVFFDTGVSTAYGRRLDINYDGSVPTIVINGLPKTTTNGLTLTFNNPSRPTLAPKIWNWAASNHPDCTPTPTFSGTARTWPNFGTVATNVTMSPKTLALYGCGMSINVTTDTNTAGASTALTLTTTLAGTGYDSLQYGQRVKLPPSLRISYPAYGDAAQQCSAGAFSAINTGYTPLAQNFDNSSCPPEAKVGTAKLGTATGSIYVVGVSPLPAFAVYFDSGVATPFGRRIWHTYDGGSPILQVAGLPNSSSTGLELTFNNPSRPTLDPKIWAFVSPADPSCASGYTDGTAYMFPASGTAATQISGLNSYVNVTGCN